MKPRCGVSLRTGSVCGRVLNHAGSHQGTRPSTYGPEARERAARRRQWWRDFLDAYKIERGCAECRFQSERGGYFDIDHIDRSNGPNTAVTIMCRRLNPEREDHMQRVFDELAKCQVLCVACHREKTAHDLMTDWEEDDNLHWATRWEIRTLKLPTLTRRSTRT